MTQGSPMNTTINPPEVVQLVKAEAPNILELWRAQKEHSSTEHAAYALARLNFSARKNVEPNYVSSPEFIEIAMKKMIKTFTPNKRERPFRVMLTLLERYSKSYSRQLPSSFVTLGVEGEEAVQVQQLALQLFLEARLLGEKRMIAMAPVSPPLPPKKPYVRPA